MDADTRESVGEDYEEMLREWDRRRRDARMKRAVWFYLGMAVSGLAGVGLIALIRVLGR